MRKITNYTMLWSCSCLLLFFTNCSVNKNIDVKIEEKINEKINSQLSDDTLASKTTSETTSETTSDKAGKKIDTNLDENQEKNIKSAADDSIINKIITVAKEKIDKAIDEKRDNSNENRNVNIANTNTYVVEYDFTKGSYTRNNLSPKVDAPVVYRIKNINRLAYNVVIKGVDSVLADSSWKEDDITKLKKDMEVSEQQKVESSVFPSSVTSQQPVSVLEEDLSKYITDGFKKKFKELVNLNQQLLQDTRTVTELEHIKETLNQELKKVEVNQDSSLTASKVEVNQDSALKTKIKENNDMIKSKQELIRDTTLKIDTASNDIPDYDHYIKKYTEDGILYNKNFSTLKNKYFEIIKIENLYSDLRTFCKDPLLTPTDFNIKCDEKQVNSLNNEFKKITDAYDDFKKEYSSLSSHFDALKESYMELAIFFDFGGRRKLFDDFESSKNEANKMYEELKKTNVLESIETMKLAIKTLKDPQSYVFTSSPVQPMNDVAIFHVSIKKRKIDENGYHDEKKFSHREFTRGGMRLDFGVGLAGSYFGDAPVYTITKDYIRKEADYSYFSSVLGTVTTTFRSSSLTTFGITAGIGVNIVDGKIQSNNFYFGPSAVLGRYERFCFTVGGSVKGIEVLKSGYGVNEQIPTTGPKEISAFTETRTRVGYFASITYSLTKGVKSNLHYVKK
ncbi:hypothetical protein [Flavobacterium sp. GT3R68]|uniref:hypothetical protein n=1 Tax=Flavobacterium sp. GT3R68 TaxID=2594437 RepID=UPI000F86DBC5|nr:hypothetical protein [Flavobacterium sp. GT3R68]RTY90620.1 hypothetical protein EKL32_20585 [Flavobacterium sp. GSN2]TRW89854.1 hypothetical protein FNW07_12480 [Flavobacterium sp. GT3R68]